MVPYKTVTVFSCSPHLPIIVAECDVSCEPTFVNQSCGCGNTPLGGLEPARWNILSFYKEKGFSQVNAVARDSPYVLGANPSWIPALVPRVFEDPDDNAPRSAGLGGDLATLIGLMAFHGRRGRASDVFTGGNWQQNRWHGSQRAPSGCKSTSSLHQPPAILRPVAEKLLTECRNPDTNPQDGPDRGFVVHIALNIPAEGLDEVAIEAFKRDFEIHEWNTVFVRE